MNITKQFMAKRQRTEQDKIFFWRPYQVHGYLSNWSTHGVDEGPHHFQTVEHYLMFHKAMAMGDTSQAGRILQAKSPNEAKKMGRAVVGFKEELWEAVREDIMLRGLRLKVEQHPDLRKELLLTKGKTLAEASPKDMLWGIGLSAKDPRAQDEPQWRGRNLLGKAWMRVRDE